MTDLMTEQARLEERMASLGIERYRAQAVEARQHGAATRSRSVSYVLDAAILPMAKAVEDFRTDAMSGRAGRRHSAVKAIEGMDADVVAFVTTKLVLDGIVKGQDLTPLAIRIGSALELEQRVAAYRKEKKKSAHVATVKRDLDRRTRNVAHRRAVFSHVLDGAGDGWKTWNTREKLVIGTKLVELLVTSTGLLEFDRRLSGKNRTATVVCQTQRMKDWLATLDVQAEILAPEYLPCVVPPKDWDDLTGGGYHTDAFAYPLKLVKTRSKLHQKALAKADLSQVYSAVNAIQRTPWAVNARVLEVAQALSDTGQGHAGLPPMEDEELPPKPHDIDTNEEARAAWRRTAAAIYARNRALFSRRVQTIKTLNVAQEFSPYDAIYFPHQLDFRGRVYAVPAALNPQGTDLAKGLLQFSTGDPIDTTAAERWFLIHGANCFGVDKVSFDERVEWVSANAGQIVNCALHPLDDLWWTQADSPFCFLAWCFEFSDRRRAKIAGTEFRSRIAIAMDGSCNGLQHYSAMLRDPVAGRAVNLVPSDAPQDIYGEVARVVKEGLYRTAMSEHHPDAGYATDEDRKDWELADRWGAFGIDRKITKRPVMVLPYGGTLNSCQKYVFDAVSERGGHGFSSEDLRPACNWLGGRVWSGIGDVVVSARLAMGWLREAAGVVAKEGRPLQWTTPSGFVVVQSYLEVRSRRIDTTLLGQRFQPQINEPVPDKLDRRRQVNGVAPNFVHSLDAAALILTVNEAARRGVTKFAMIHDSYGTTAAASPTLASALRDEFVRMYEEHETLEEFREEAIPGDLRDGVSCPPTVGGLDLNLVRQSDYFFA